MGWFYPVTFALDLTVVVVILWALYSALAYDLKNKSSDDE